MKSNKTERIFRALIASACISLLLIVSLVSSENKQEKPVGMIVIKVEKAMAVLEGSMGKTQTMLNGEVVYKMIQTEKGLDIKLDSLGLTGTSVKARDDKTGTISIMLKPESAQTVFDPKRKSLENKFLVELHYPLIDRIKGYIVPKEKEVERDDHRSYTEIFAGKLTCQLYEEPRISKEEIKLKKGVDMDIQLTLKEKVIGEIYTIKATAKFPESIIIPYSYQKVIKIQPIFIRYTPDTGCFGGTTTATTGGSYWILRDRAIEMWDRCCIGLDFLPIVYIHNNDYRILSSDESFSLLSLYDDPDSIEVFFVEVSDPVGMWGGGGSFSSGTANAKVITFDTNLPINLYNLAHELGHSLGLSHPSSWGNSTPGSLMEPSGFCADNPVLMSSENCKNGSNPLLVFKTPLRFCKKNPNM